MLGELNKIYDPEVYPYPADLGNFSQAYWKLVRYQTDTVPGASRRIFARGCKAKLCTCQTEYHLIELTQYQLRLN